jgi:four helix bundle protein
VTGIEASGTANLQRAKEEVFLAEKSLKSHKDLAVWQRAMDLALKTYAATGRFPHEELYGLTAQARRSAVSIPSNIAEGAARNSSKELIQYLHVSLGSLAELETQLLLSERMGFLSETSLFEDLNTVRKMLIGLLRALKGKSFTRHSSLVTGHLSP